MSVEIHLLGRFEVAVDDVSVPAQGWARRHAAALVKILALAPGRALHREQVLDLLWPEDSLAEAAPKLHKAAHFARKATGRPDAVVLQGETVQLFPSTDLAIDVVTFEELARAALAANDRELAEQAAAGYGGELLPQDIYEEWADARRASLRARYLELLRCAERWDDVVELEPGEERAHLELMRLHARRGDRHAALRQFERMDRALRNELGVQPSREAFELREQLIVPTDPTPQPEAVPIGRSAELSVLRETLADVAEGRGRVVIVSGPPGIGKSMLLGMVLADAAARGWRVGSGVAAAVEGAWPYAPVLDTLADLCRRHPTLLDGLADSYREEIDRALAGVPTPWTAETGHQRLFVAVAELVRLAGASTPVLLVIDDLHEADEASLRLLHYLARSTIHDHVYLLLAHRGGPLPKALEETRTSLITRQGARDVVLAPFDDEQALALIQRYVAAPDAELVERISALAGGIPFAIAEMARRAAVEPAWAHFLEVSMVAGVGPATRDVLQRVAVVGAAFDTDEFVALSGLDDAEAYDHLERALAARVIEPASSGYRFRHRLVRDALLEDVPPHRRRRIHADAAAQLSALGASPARIGHHLLQAGDVNAAVPHLLAAAEVEAAVGAYRDSLELVDSVRPYAAGAERARLLALRADLLMAIGDPTATAAYREALDASGPSTQRRLRARLARAAVMSGDLDTADAALAGLEPDGSEEDGEILLAQGHLAFYSSDFERAWDISETARQRVLAGDKNWQVLDLIALQGLLAHNRGVWFEGMRAELRRTRDAPEIANAVFDGYLCPAEYLLYGPTPYADVIEIAGQLRSTARRSGALRAVAFATALAGEAALLSGDLPLAATELQEAVDLHHDLGSAAGEAHSLQRLAEVRLAEGDLAEANRLAQQALPLARWSMIAPHLLQRIYGTMIAAAPDPMSARAMVDRAESTFGVADHCNFCSVMLAVPAAVACVDCGDLDHARSYLEVAEGSAKLWDGTAWEAAVDEAKAHLAVAEGEPERALELLDGAARRFDQAGQPRDRDRCRRMAEPLLSGR